MKFNHVEYPEEMFPPLPMKYIGGKRHYQTPCGCFPSMTTVLSIRDERGLEAWKNQVGPEVAKFVAGQAAIRGNGTHKILEDYLKNNDISIYEKNLLQMALFKSAKPVFERINNIHLQELILYSSQFRIAGRPDIIADFDEKLSVIDFKTSRRKKKEEWIENYYLQETGYSIMWEERTSIPIEQIVTIISSEDGEVQTFVKKPSNFVKQLKVCVDEFYMQKTKDYSQMESKLCEIPLRKRRQSKSWRNKK